MVNDSGHTVVVVGGGIAGLAVAKMLASNRISTVLIEKGNRLGGYAAEWACMATDKCLRCFCCHAADLREQTLGIDGVTAMLGWRLSAVNNSQGRLESVCIQNLRDGKEKTLEVSGLVLAVGFEPYDPKEKIFWGYSTLPGVLTLAEVDRLIRNDAIEDLAAEISEPLKIAFFQCVGSRDAGIGANYCSQYCCKAALRMSLRLAYEHPDWEISLFYIDLQVAGKFAGELLEEARVRNIKILQGVPGEVSMSGDGLIEVIRESDGKNIRENFHRIILSIGQRPSADTAELACLTGVNVSNLGFFETSGVFDGGRTNQFGIYVAGTCSGPMDIENTLEHAGRTAGAIIADRMETIL
jgi:heterodisulfide reductase subunit A2